MERLTEKRDGKAVIPLRNAVCGVDMPRWCISKESDIQSFLSGDAADRLAAYEDTGLEPEEITTEPQPCVFYSNRKCNLDGDWCAEGPGCQRELDKEQIYHLRNLLAAEAALRVEEHEH